MDQFENPTGGPVTVKVKPEAWFSFKGLVRVFSRPAEFFGQLKDNPKVLVPLIAMFVLAMIAVYFLLDQVVAMMGEAQYEALSKQGMSDAKIEKFTHSRFMKIGPLLNPIVIMLTPFITAGLAMLVGGFIMGGKSEYWKVVSVMAYSEVVYYAGGMIDLPFQVMKGTLIPAFSLAVLVSDLSFNHPLVQFLARISPFYIWHVIVAGIGLSILFEFSRNKGYLIAVLSLGLLSALHIGSAALGQMFN